MSATTSSAGAPAPSADRGAFSGRTAFIFAAIGSAVGLGNIWRFPAVAYENGGGAFILPYLVALLSAGIPLLFLDYAIGHRWRGSAPMAWRRFRRWTEFIGWWQVLIALIIALYYALILAWATNYTIFSFDQRWGDDAAGFFGEYTQALGGADATISFYIVPAVLDLHDRRVAGRHRRHVARCAEGHLRQLRGVHPAAGDHVRDPRGEGPVPPGRDRRPRRPLQAQLGGAAGREGVDRGLRQIFFSLSVAFGIMLTYSSYLKKKTDLTGSGLVVGFANSSFEILAGIGVFSALGFMAQAQGVGD